MMVWKGCLNIRTGSQYNISVLPVYAYDYSFYRSVRCTPTSEVQYPILEYRMSRFFNMYLLLIHRMREGTSPNKENTFPSGLYLSSAWWMPVFHSLSRSCGKRAPFTAWGCDVHQRFF